MIYCGAATDPVHSVYMYKQRESRQLRAHFPNDQVGGASSRQVIIIQYMCNVCRPVKQINSHTQSRPKLTGITSPRTLFFVIASNCCYMSVDSKRIIHQNRIWSYEISPHRITNRRVVSEIRSYLWHTLELGNFRFLMHAFQESPLCSKATPSIHTLWLSWIFDLEFQLPSIFIFIFF